MSSHPVPAASAPDSPYPPSPNSPSESLLVRAARREPVSRTPVWFMRQAGRSLPEYRRLREGIPMLEACLRPDLVTEITLQPVRRHGVDAAILFSDIVVPLKAVGVGLDIVPGVGPVVAEPLSSRADLDRLPDLGPDGVPQVAEAVRMLVAQLGQTPLIGFSGAPFTLASYLVEGGPSRTHERTKALMHADPELWHDLCARLASIAGAFLRSQVDAGVSAVQLFDSWAGCLDRVDYVEHVLPHSAAVLAAVGERVPRIHFGVGTGELLPAMASAGCEVVGVDFRVRLPDAVARLQAAGAQVAVQGNLDPALLGAPWPVIEAAVRRIVREGMRATDECSGHIFNLGHGVPPQTDPEVLTRIVELVHECSAP